MPYTLKQLQDKRDSCIKKIQELKATAEDKGCKDHRHLNFSSDVLRKRLRMLTGGSTGNGEGSSQEIE